MIDVYGYCRFPFLGILSELRFFILAGIRPTTLAEIGFGEYICKPLGEGGINKNHTQIRDGWFCRWWGVKIKIMNNILRLLSLKLL